MTLIFPPQLGESLLYFLDYVIGCAWWIMILQIVMVGSVFFSLVFSGRFRSLRLIFFWMPPVAGTNFITE